MKTTFCVGIGVGVFAVIGCVNIPKKIETHITLDIRHHIEQQAQSTLDFIEGKEEQIPEAPTPEPGADKTSAVDALFRLIDPMPSAWAAELKSSSPEIAKIAGALRARFDEVQRIKSKGYAGESNRGYLELRNPEKITSADERNEIQRLIAAENADRKALYQEVAKLNADQGVAVSTVESIYALERLRRAKPGEIFQLPTGADFEQFKKTDVAKRLGAEAVAGDWVVIK